MIYIYLKILRGARDHRATGQFSDFNLLLEFMSTGDCPRIQCVVWDLGTSMVLLVLTMPFSM